MNPLIGIFQSLFVIYGAWWGFAYYTGRVNYSGTQEDRRANRVKKYGAFLIVGIVLCAFGGPILLILKIAELLSN